MMTERDYFAQDTAFQAERDRLSLVERLFDPATQQFLSRTGVGPGWRCCEIGAGGGSITRWLAGVVGESGKVVAVDLDTRFLSEIAEPNVEVVEGDFLTHEHLSGPFDLVFTRFVLVHVSQLAQAVRRMASLAKPSAWVLAFELDAGTMAAADRDYPGASAFDAVVAKLERYNLDHGIIDTRAGRHLAKHFEDAGLEDVAVSAWTNLCRGASPEAELWRRTFEVSGPKAVSAGAISQAEQDLRLAALEDPAFRFLEPLWFQISGRKASL